MPANTKYNNEIIVDYKMFDKMSKDIALHYKTLLLIRKNIAKNKKVASDLKFEFLENLDIIIKHMKNAEKELNKSKRVINELI